MATIQTATGPIDTADMGFTLMHEHVRITWPPLYVSYPELDRRDAMMAVAVDRLKQAQAAGISTVVDLTPIDLGRDPRFLAEAARVSGMQVIVPTGFYYYHNSYFSSRPWREMTDLMVNDITEGIGTSGVRANVIKCASQPEVDAHNRRVLRASARAHRETGVPICTHTDAPNRTGTAQQEVFKADGVDLGRVVIGHSDDSDDFSYLEEIIANGSYCGMDRIGLTMGGRSSAQRADMVAKLVEHGYAERVTLSHDASCCGDTIPEQLLAERFPDWNLEFIPGTFSQMLRDRGVTDAQIRTMTVENPRRIFECQGAY